MSCIVSPTGVALRPLPRPDKDYHRPVSPGTRKRNDLFLSLHREHGLTHAQIGAAYSLKVTTVRSGILEASKRANPAPAIDHPELTLSELMDTPLTDEPDGPKYLDHPDLEAWGKKHEHYFRPEPGPAPIRNGIRRRPGGAA